MNILIITGGSKGIGKALAQKYHSENYTVFSIARSELENCNYTQIIAVLSTESSQININLSNYASGLYTVALVCNGQVVDAKTLIKQ